MDEKELKTSPKQRIFIAVIAIIMLGSMIAGYAAIVINGSNKSSADASSDTQQVDPAKVAEYEEAYNKKVAEFGEATKKDFDKFMGYEKDIIKAYNETSANTGGVQTNDLHTGSGEAVAEDGSNYLAYYVGWCADESVFDSSLNDPKNPTAFSKVLDPSMGMIEGWTAGVDGMNIGGVREITIPSQLAYADKMEICGGYNKPLKFLVMAVAKEDSLNAMSKSLDDAYMRWQYAQYGIDYDSVKANQE